MNTLPQFQPLLKGKNTPFEVSNRAREIREWVQSVDNSRSDSNDQTNCIDHVQQGMGFTVQAEFKNLTANSHFTREGQAFELNRLLVSHKDGSQVATQVQVFESMVTGFEVTRWQDGSFRGYQFSGCPSDAGKVSMRELAGEEAQSNWSRVYVGTMNV